MAGDPVDRGAADAADPRPHPHGDRAYEWVGSLSARRARLSPDRVAVADTAAGEEYTYADLDARANRTARFLRDVGVEKGDRVAVVSRNRVELLDLFFATAKVGAVLAPLSHRLAERELAAVLGDVDPALLAVETPFEGDVVDALERADAEPPVRAIATDADNAWRTLESSLPADDSAVEPTEVSLADPHLFLHTGGSTGTPKETVISHGAIRWNAFNTITAWGLREDDVTPMVFPMFHTGGWNVLTVPLLQMGAKILLSPEVDPVEELTPGTYTLEPTDGPTYEIIVEDTQFSPDTAQNVATNLVLDEDVDILFGGTSSDSARRLIDTVVDETDVPYLIGPAADAGITVSDEFCHPLAFRASEHTAMDARAGGTYVAENFDIDTVAVFASDNAFGQSVAENYTAVLESQGVEVLEPRFVEVGYSEFDGLFEEAVSNGASGVVGGFTASTLPQFLTSGISFDVQVFGGFAALLTTKLIGGTIESALGEGFTEQDIKDAGLGPFTSRYHWNQYENPINEEFRQMHVDAYDIVPDLFSSGTFTAASALSQAVTESGSTDGADVAEALRGMTVADTPKGADGYTFQGHNNQAASQMTVAWPVPTSDEFADTWDAPIMPGEPLARLDAEDVMVPEEDASCSL